MYLFIYLFIDAQKKQIEVQMFEKCADNLEMSIDNVITFIFIDPKEQFSFLCVI